MVWSLSERLGGVRRMCDGAEPYVSTKAALNRRMLANPAAKAIAVMGSVVSLSNNFAI